MSTEIALVPIAGLQLLSVYDDGKVLAPMKQMSEEIGLPWKAQHQRIHNTEILAEGIRIIQIPSPSGGPQETLCLPIKLAFVWLVTVPVGFIRDPETRKRVDALQRESFDAMYDYWTKGIATNPRATAATLRIDLARQAMARRNLPKTLDRLEKATNPTTRRIELALARADCETLGIVPPVPSDYPVAQPDLFPEDAGEQA